MKKLLSYSYLIIGALFGILILEPLLLSLFTHKLNGEAVHWWVYIRTIYLQVFDFWNFDQAIINISFSIIGIGLAYLVKIRKKIFSKQNTSTSKTDIQKMIRSGESQKVEFKSTLRWDVYQSKPNKDLEDVIIKTIIGYMNTSGGNLLIGVDDDGQIFGLEKDYKTLKKQNKDGFEQYIYQLISTKIGTQFTSLARVKFYVIEEKEICLIKVEKSKIATFLYQNNKSIFYVRSGNSTRELDAKEALEFIKKIDLKF